MIPQYADTGRIPRGKPWYSHRISGEQRPEIRDCPGFATHRPFLPDKTVYFFPSAGVNCDAKWHNSLKTRVWSPGCFILRKRPSRRVVSNPKGGTENEEKCKVLRVIGRILRVGVRRILEWQAGRRQVLRAEQERHHLRSDQCQYYVRASGRRQALHAGCDRQH